MDNHICLKLIHLLFSEVNFFLKRKMLHAILSAWFMPWNGFCERLVHAVAWNQELTDPSVEEIHNEELRHMR
jgi:hypothetical protein